MAISPQPPEGIVVNTIPSANFDQPVVIPNDGTITEVEFNVGIEGKVWDIDLQTFISHLTPKDLTLILTSPPPFSKSVVLMSSVGKKPSQAPYQAKFPEDIVHNEPPPDQKPPIPKVIDDIKIYYDTLNGTIWDDQAKLPVSEVQYSIETQSKQASLQPEGALDVFRGINSKGVWKLAISDQNPASIYAGEVKEIWKWTEEKVVCFPDDPTLAFEAKIAEIKNKWGTGNFQLEVIWDGGFCLDFHYTLTYVHSKNFANSQSLTNCNLIITTAIGESPFQWTSLTNSNSQAFNNNSVVISDITVTNQGSNLEELELYTDIDHNSSGDLRISLISPKGTTNLITINNGADLDNVFANTLWDDQAVTPATDASYLNTIAKRTLIPEGALALFRGENPNGTWTLKITDEDGNDLNSLGKLNQWGLRLTSYVAPKNPLTIPPPSAFNGMTLKTVAYTNYQPHNIQNFSTLIVPFQVTGLEGSVWDVDFTTFLRHFSTKDLIISLISPDGKKAVLSSGNGFQRGPFPENYFPEKFELDYNQANPPNVIPPFPFDNFVLPAYSNLLNGVSWNDQATLPITDADYSADLPLGSVTPEGALDIFRGIDPNGEWKLEIQDTRDNQAASGTSRWFLQYIDHMASFSTEGLVTNCSLHLTVANGNSEIKDTGFTNIVNEALTGMPLADEISVSGVGSKLEQVKVYTKISHPSSGKLDLTLTSPSGKKVVLSTGNGGNAANIFQGTVWDDRASTDLRVTDVNFNNNQVEPLLVPEGALALFRGENPNGIWTLTVSDSQAAGTLEEWGLFITAYSVLLPPIVDYPPPPPPLPPPPYSLGNAYLFGQKSKTAYLLKQQNGTLKEKPRAISELKAKHKIAAANYFSVPGTTNPMLCLILQYKKELTAKEVGTDGDFLNDAPLIISPLTEKKDKVVASGDLNQDGYNDLVVQGKRRSVKILYGPDFPASSLPLTNNFRKLGKVVGVAGNRILSRKRNILYATALPTDTNDFVSPPEILANGLKASLKIRGVADISETPGLELIVQEGKRIGYGPLNLNSPFGYIYTNRSDLNMGKAVGPR